MPVSVVVPDFEITLIPIRAANANGPYAQPRQIAAFVYELAADLGVAS